MSTSHWSGNVHNNILIINVIREIEAWGVSLNNFFVNKLLDMLFINVPRGSVQCRDVSPELRSGGGGGWRGLRQHGVPVLGWRCGPA